MEGSGVEKDPLPRGNGMTLITHEVNREISLFLSLGYALENWECTALIVIIINMEGQQFMAFSTDAFS